MSGKSKAEKRLQGAVFQKSALAGIEYLQGGKAEAKKRLKNPAVRKLKSRGAFKTPEI